MRALTPVPGAVLLSVALLLSFACDSDPDERTLITSPRLLALQSSPPALRGVESAIEIRALVIDGDGEEINDEGVRYRACSPWEFLIDPSQDCPEGSALALDGTRLTAQRLLDFYPPPPSLGNPQDNPSDDPPQEPGTCARSASIEVPIVAEVTIGEVSLLTVKRVPVYLTEVLRRNPKIESIEVVAGAEGEHTISVEMDRESLDTECRNDREVLEAVRVFLYSTSGSFESSSIDIVPTQDGQIESGEVVWTSSGQAATLYFVAIDNDGGVTWESISI